MDDHPSEPAPSATTARDSSRAPSTEALTALETELAQLEAELAELETTDGSDA